MFAEKFLLKLKRIKKPLQRLLFPMSPDPAESLLTGNRRNTKIETIERPEERHCYMVYQYRDGLTSFLVPSIPSCKSGVEKPILARYSHQGSWDERL